MEEEFYATIKLVSGEEIVARIAYMPEEESCLIHEPMEVEHVVKRGKGIDGFTLKDWIHASFDDLFVLPKIHILTMSECDKRIEKFYLKCLKPKKFAHPSDPCSLESRSETFMAPLNIHQSGSLPNPKILFFIAFWG